MKRWLLFVWVLAFTILFNGALFAQKLPRVQTVSVWAPSTIKIDGKLAEWPDAQLSAYNPLNRIHYVVSNDDENLYLTVHGSGTGSGFKILKEGLVFTISSSADKKLRETDGNNVSVRFPTTQFAPTVSSVMYSVSQANRLYLADPDKNKGKIDTLTAATNNRVNQMAKEIGIKGIKQIPDSTLSVYNDTGIKARLQFVNGEPVLEMAVPLKYLHLKSTSERSFSYNISLPVPKLTAGFEMPMKAGDDVRVSDDDLFRLTETNFWGEYTLAKKP